MQRVKLACTGSMFRRWNIEEAIESIAKIGYDGMQIMTTRPHAYPSDLDGRARKKLKKILESNNLEVAGLDSVHLGELAHMVKETATRTWPPEGEPLWTSGSLALRYARINYTKQCIDLANELGTNYCLVSSGRPMVHPALAWEYLIDGLKECTEYAAKKEVYIGLELHNDLVAGTPEEAMRAIEEVSSPWLGVNFDVGHMHIAKIPIRESVRKLGKLIKGVHIDDMEWNKHFHLVPGQGEVDLKVFTESLLEIGYEGYICVEVYTEPYRPQEAIKQSLDYVTKLLEEVYGS